MDEQNQRREMPGNDAHSQFKGEGSANNDRKKRVAWYRRKRIIIPFLFFLLVAAVIFLYWYTDLRGYVSTDDAYIDGNRMAISSKILGRIDELKVDEGDTVQPGQLLVVIDDSNLKADEAKSEANIAYSKHNADLAKVSLDLARDDFRRAKVQFEDSIISAQEYDHAKKALELAKAKYDMAIAATRTAEAELNVITAELANTRLYAPYNGIVAKRWVITGDVVAPGQPVFTIFDLSDVWVTAYFEETKIASFQVGDSARISVDAYSGHDFLGGVLFMGAATASQFSLIPPNNASGNFTKVTQRVPVKISIRQADASGADGPIVLIPGMSVVVKIDARGK
jgi:membrane fusion protein (multidrug efflux system)